MVFTDSVTKVEGLAVDGVPVTSDVPKKLENASVTGSCGSSLITFILAGDVLDGSGLGGAGFVSKAFTGVGLADIALGSATVADLGLGCNCFGSGASTENVGFDAFGAAKKGVDFGAASCAGGNGSFGGVGIERVEVLADDLAGSWATGLLPLMILPSDKRYSSTPAFVIAFNATFWALFRSRLNVRVFNGFSGVSVAYSRP